MTFDNDDRRENRSPAAGEVISGEVVSTSSERAERPGGSSAHSHVFATPQDTPPGGQPHGRAAGHAVPGGYVWTFRQGPGAGGPFGPGAQPGMRGMGAPGMGAPDLAHLNLKNPLLAGLLGLVLGPLGLLYATIPWALVTGGIAALLVMSYLWLLLPALWVVCGGIGFVSVTKKNVRAVMAEMTGGMAGQAGGQRPGGPAPHPHA